MFDFDIIFKANFLFLDDGVSIICDPKNIFVDQTTNCQVNFYLQNFSYKSEIYYGDINMNIDMNTTNETMKFERTFLRPGIYDFKVKVNDLNIYAKENVTVKGSKKIKFFFN